MSLNLYIEVDGNELEIYQTPTYITKMCLAPNKQGKVSKTRAINAYIEYVRSKANGVYETAEEAKDARQKVNDHIDEVMSALAGAEKIEVCAL